MGGRLLCNIDRAVLELNGLTMDHPFLSGEELTTRISKHYKQALLRKMYKIIGSVEILGNPVSLISNLGTGVYDFFNEPAQAIVHSPADFGLGLKRGTSSLVHKSAYGIANSAGKLTGGIAQIASFLTFDQHFQQQWEDSQRHSSSQGAKDVFQRAANNAKSGMAHALYGVVSSPFQGARSGGATGALVGALKGTSGIFVKPLVSVFGSASIMAQGIGNTFMNWESERVRSRMPRCIDNSGVLRIYDTETAAGHALLKCLTEGKYSEEWYKKSFCVTEGILLLSDRHCLIVQNSSVIFEKSFKSIIGLQLAPDCVLIQHELCVSGSYFFAPKSSRTRCIYPIDPADVEPLYELLLVACRDAQKNLILQ